MSIQSVDRTSSADPLHTPQRYERIAERLTRDICDGALREGERLPAERELARRLGVGRASVREAIAALQLQGVVETRPGAGSFVVPDARERLRGDEPVHDASPSAMLEARAAIEPSIVRLAAQRAQPDPLAEELMAAMDGEPDGAAWNRADRLFHRQLAAMTGNPVLLAVADSIAALMDQPLWQRLRDESVAVPGRMALHAAEHRLIYEAIVAGDADAAAFYASRHIERVRRYMTLDDPPPR
ncbi:MAG TPA: FadR/GntR family transcriptional regulator [Solirubrobacteraceae bacterium]